MQASRTSALAGLEHYVRVTRTDPALERLVGVADFPLKLAGGPTDSFARIPRAPPWSILGFVATSPTFRISDLARVDARAALDLLRVHSTPIRDHAVATQGTPLKHAFGRDRQHLADL